VQRADILQAAAQVFREKGYHGASMEDIARAVGLRKASLYHHVRSKEDILVALLDMALDQLIADLEPVVDSDLSPADKLRKAIRTYILRLTEQPDLASVLLLEHRSLSPRPFRRQAARRDAYESLWRQIIREGVERGDFRRVDERIAGFALLGVQNWMITWFRAEGRLSPRQIADQFAGLFLEGLRAPDGRAKG
jgi:AcrR family transcriptional regulator